MNIKWRTELALEALKRPISYKHKLLAFGSCFVENIGQRLQELKYNIEINPFGIQYNPASIGQGLQILLQRQSFVSEDLFEYQGLWHSFMHHGSFSGTDRLQTLQGINERLSHAATRLLETDFLLLTLGTAWVYANIADGKVVNNCHKLPSNHFTHYRLSVEDCVMALQKPLQILLDKNPNMQVLLTVSPIRHLKDGFRENQLSKATLQLACESLEQRFARIAYFPAYELLLDDLRDYRFYARDLTHPNELAIDYIWEKFEQSCLAAAESDTRKTVRKIVQALSHRPLHPDSEAYQQFLKEQQEKIEMLKKQWPEIQF